jgi:hypothetical protein
VGSGRQGFIDSGGNGAENPLAVLKFYFLFGGMYVHINLARVNGDENKGLGIPPLHQALTVPLYDGFCYKPVSDIPTIYVNEQSVGPFPGKIRWGGMDGNMEIVLLVFTTQYGLAGRPAHEMRETQMGFLGCGEMENLLLALFQAEGNARKRHGSP